MLNAFFLDALTKIPIIPVMQQQTCAARKLPTVATIVQQRDSIKHHIAKPVIHTQKPTKKAGHNIIERRYRTSIVRIFVDFL